MHLEYVRNFNLREFTGMTGGNNAASQIPREGRGHLSSLLLLPYKHWKIAIIVLGFLFWAKQALYLIPLHMRLGVIEVFLLWAMAILALSARIKIGLVVTALLWGLLTAYFGMKMGSLLPGPAHEIIRVLHFLIGLGAIGLAETLAARVKRSGRLAAVTP